MFEIYSRSNKSFEDLDIWSNPIVRKNLSWYLLVAINQRPSKYLISMKVPIEVNDFTGLGIEELWLLHHNATKEFLSYWEKIKKDPSFFEELELPEKSLMDLNFEIVWRSLKKCDYCEWHCNVDRTSESSKKGTCKLGVISRVASYFPHHGEELVFRGTRGSGTIFFSSCNMRCVFCQNGDISKDKDNGNIVNGQTLADIIFELRALGAHNINLVGGDPTPHLHTIIEAIKILPKIHQKIENKAKNRGYNKWLFKLLNQRKNYLYNGYFNAPILWNSNFYMSVEAMNILRTIVDVWLPDFKFGNNKCARRLSRTPRYFETITRNLKKIDEWDEDYVIRHLIMPNHLECCSFPVIDWIQKNIPRALVNLMAQYHPEYYSDPSSPLFSDRYEDISRRVSRDEVLQVYEYAKQRRINFEAITFDRP